jgi:hypothetical protein
MYHARMFAFSVLCAVTFFVLVIGAFYLLLSLGVLQPETNP